MVALKAAARGVAVSVTVSGVTLSSRVTVSAGGARSRGDAGAEIAVAARVVAVNGGHNGGRYGVCGGHGGEDDWHGLQSQRTQQSARQAVDEGRIVEYMKENSKWGFERKKMKLECLDA